MFYIIKDISELKKSENTGIQFDPQLVKVFIEKVLGKLEVNTFKMRSEVKYVKEYEN